MSIEGVSAVDGERPTPSARVATVRGINRREGRSSMEPAIGGAARAKNDALRQGPDASCVLYAGKGGFVTARL